MKPCLLICNKNATTLKEVFPLIKNKILRMGYTVPKDYDQPPGYEYKSLQGLTRWMTTLSVSNKPPLILTATYDPDKYPKYDNYEAINVNSIKDIPYDYDGVMGVPITILDHNLDNVEIIGTEHYLPDGKSICQVDNRYGNQFATKDKSVYKRILIKKKIVIEGLLYGEYTEIDGEYIKGHRPILNNKQMYSRALIRRKTE